MIFFLYIDEDDVREMQVHVPHIVCFWSCCVMKPIHCAENIEKDKFRSLSITISF